ncbi:hypothetical protein IKG20_00275 [Candidatus Saccharibacteria bacterium]|nr:hypothetical protein [Candidatus Saccharibacteria bacterium]
MNKETIYIEPSDDITDILSKLKASDKKIVALVPPKKPSVLLSAVNIKLIARTAKAEKKAVVIISTDDSLTKLAMAANLPVAPSLKSRPVMPDEAQEKSATAAPKPEETETEEDDDEEEPEDTEAEDDDEEDSEDDDDEDNEDDEDDDDEDGDDEEDDEDKEDEDDEDDEEKDEKADDKEEKSKKAKKPKGKESKKNKKKDKEDEEYPNAFVAFIATHKTIVAIGALAIVGIAVFLFWAFTIAPRVEVAVSVRTTAANFSENVSFVKKAEDEKVENGVFLLHEEKIENEQTVKFTATGKKDMGEPASGTLIAYSYFNDKGSISIPAGSKFSLGEFTYVSTEDATLSLSATNNGTLKTVCNNFDDQSFDLNGDGCQISTTVSIKADAAGEDYNVAADTSGWTSSIAGVRVYNHDAITGGTSRIVTIVNQSDVDLALDKLKSENAGDGKNQLYGKLSNTVMPIDASYKVSATDPKSTPGVGEEVSEGTTPEISTKTTYSVYTVERTHIEDFIKKKAGIEEGRRLYSVGEPFIEYFAEGSEGVYTAKLKTTYKAGPEISETEILDKIRGEKIGRVEPILKDAFSGISSVKTTKSYFWVNSIPSDENKVKIELTVEE